MIRTWAAHPGAHRLVTHAQARELARIWHVKADADFVYAVNCLARTYREATATVDPSDFADMLRVATTKPGRAWFQRVASRAKELASLLDGPPGPWDAIPARHRGAVAARNYLALYRKSDDEHPGTMAHRLRTLATGAARVATVRAHTKARRTRPLSAVIHASCLLYVASTGRLPGVSYNAMTGQSGGALVRFLERLLSFTRGPTRSRAALAQAIRREKRAFAAGRTDRDVAAAYRAHAAEYVASLRR